MPTFPRERCLALTTLCVDDDEGAIKVISSELSMHSSVLAKWFGMWLTQSHPFEVYLSSWTKWCRQLTSERYCFWLQNHQRCLTGNISLQCGPQQANTNIAECVQVTKETCHMREQCVPGSLPSSPTWEPGNEASLHYAITLSSH